MKNESRTNPPSIPLVVLGLSFYCLFFLNACKKDNKLTLFQKEFEQNLGTYHGETKIYFQYYDPIYEQNSPNILGYTEVIDSMVTADIIVVTGNYQDSLYTIKNISNATSSNFDIQPIKWDASNRYSRLERDFYNTSTYYDEEIVFMPNSSSLKIVTQSRDASLDPPLMWDKVFSGIK